MQQLLNRWLPAATLATWSAVLFYYHFSARMGDMLAMQFRAYAFASAIVLAVMAVVFILFKADASCCSTAECGHGLSRLATGKLLTFLVLLLPITVAARYTPENGFSAQFVENRGTITSAVQLSGNMKVVAKTPDLPLPGQGAEEGSAKRADGSDPAIGTLQEQPTDFLKRTPEGNIVAEVLDLLYAAQDKVLQADFEGKKVELIAQFLPDTTNNPNGNRFKAVRMFMSCCAADAQPVATLVEVEKMPAIKEMEWVKIIGVPSFPVEKGRRISVLKGISIEKTSAPEESMLQ
jgi:uncharacterized membrane protein YcgQ (UPF0703/DUF1980 family)